MNQPPAVPRDPMTADADHLKLLAIFHFVVAGFAVVAILFLCLHYALMTALFTNPKIAQQPDTHQLREFFGILQWFYALAGALLVMGGLANLVSGLWIRARRHRVFSLIVAGLNCVQIPFGTALGVFTIIVLVRDSVVELYEGKIKS